MKQATSTGERILNIMMSTRRDVFYYLNLVLPSETIKSQLTPEIVHKALLSIKFRANRLTVLSNNLIVIRYLSTLIN